MTVQESRDIMSSEIDFKGGLSNDLTHHYRLILDHAKKNDYTSREVQTAYERIVLTALDGCVCHMMTYLWDKEEGQRFNRLHNERQNTIQELRFD